MREQVIQEQKQVAERGETGSISSFQIGDVLRASLLVWDATSALVAISVLKERMKVVRAKPMPTPCLILTCLIDHFLAVSTVLVWHKTSPLIPGPARTNFNTNTQTRMKNKFGLWRAAAHGDATPPAPDDYQPPNIHMNLLFTAEGSLPIVCELQIQHERVMLELAPVQHKYYEIRRAADIDALLC